MSFQVEEEIVDILVSTLRLLEPELRQVGVTRLALFGSVARGESHPESDVDLAVMFDQSARVGLIELAGLELRLEEVLGRRVELTTLPIENPWIRMSVDRDLRPVF